MKDKELADHERAHNGQPGAKVKHGADARGNPGKPRYHQEMEEAMMDGSFEPDSSDPLNR